MGKHSKNNNDRAYFSHAERAAAKSGILSSSFIGYNNTKEWGWGTESRLLDSDAMKEVDVCSLSLQPCAQPLVTPSGVLYDKEVIIEYILTRKKEIEKETAAWQGQEAGDASAAAADAAAAHESRIAEFVAAQEGLSQADIRARAAAAGGGGAESSSKVTSAPSMGRSLNMDKGTHAADTSFWVVHKTPEARVRLEKPDPVVRCPMTREPLRLKTMVPVIFTPADEGEGGGGGGASSSSSSMAGKKANERFVCPLSKKPLSNVSRAVVLRPSGMAVSSACVKDIIRKDMLDPFTDPPTKLKEKDLISLRSEGTGFASRTDDGTLKATAATSSSRF